MNLLDQEYFKNGTFTYGEIRKILHDVRSGNLEHRNRAFEDLIRLSQSDENREALCDPDLCLATLLIALLQDQHHHHPLPPPPPISQHFHLQQLPLSYGTEHLPLDLQSRGKIFTIFAELAALKENKQFLASESLGLVPLLFQYINHPAVQSLIFIFFLNCCLEASTHEYILSERLGFALYTRQRMIRFPHEVYPYWAFTNIAATVNAQNLALLLQWNIHEIFMNALFSAGNNPLIWNNRYQGVAYRSLFSIFYLSIFSDESREAIMKLPGINEYFLSLFLNDEEIRERVPAAIILCNICSYRDCSYHPKDCRLCMRRDNASMKEVGDYDGVSSVGEFPAAAVTSQLSLLQQYPEILRLLVTVFYANLFYETNRESAYIKEYRKLGYNYGIFKLRAVTASLKQLALHPMNRRMMLEDRVLILLCKNALELFIGNAAECSAIGIYFSMRQHAGGGGKDIDSAEFIIELLLQLSFDDFVEASTVDYDDTVAKSASSGKGLDSTETEMEVEMEMEMEMEKENDDESVIATESDEIADDMRWISCSFGGWKRIYLDEEVEMDRVLQEVLEVANERGLSIKGIEMAKLLLQRLIE